MHGGEPRAELARVARPTRPLGLARARRPQDLVAQRPRGELHGHEPVAVRVAGVEDGAHVAVAHAAREAHLAPQPPLARGPLDRVGMKQLGGATSHAKLRVPRAESGAAAPLSEERAEHVPKRELDAPFEDARSPSLAVGADQRLAPLEHLCRRSHHSVSVTPSGPARENLPRDLIRKRASPH